MGVVDKSTRLALKASGTSARARATARSISRRTRLGTLTLGALPAGSDGLHLLDVCGPAKGPSRAADAEAITAADCDRLDEVSRDRDAFFASGSGYRLSVVARVVQHACRDRVHDLLGEMTARKDADLRATGPEISIMVSPTCTTDPTGCRWSMTANRCGVTLAASLTHVLVEQHPDQQRERVAAEQLVGGVDLASRRVGTTEILPQPPGR